MASAEAALKSDSAARDSDEGQLVVFRLAEEEFGVDIHNVKEIVRLPDITPIPRSPNYVSGICNLRGNVLPVLDTRIRFSMAPREATDQTRLLVVEAGSAITSLIVDQVREVLRIKNSLVEPPPTVCRGMDKKFLSGVVKVEEGKRLIMMLDLPEVIEVDMQAAETNAGAALARKEAAGDGVNVTEEEQLVSFKVAGEEYAFQIEQVSEILKVMEITSVPNVPDYVLGMFTIRNNLMPILDMRKLLGFDDLVTERRFMLDKAIEDEGHWAESLEHYLASEKRFLGELNPKKTEFGAWLESYNTASMDVENIVKQLKRERANLFALAAQAIGMEKKEAVAFFADKIQPLTKMVKNTIGHFKEAMTRNICEDQRTMVVESDSMTIGYLVDWVDEVLRVPRAVIDETPAMAASQRKELKAVAKFNDGERLIMIMDESALVSEETTGMLSDMKSGAGRKTDTHEEDEKSLAEQSMDEEQLVTFSIDKEEYGIRIMQVQEINRLTEVTQVPRAPAFIDGMTNLRGNVIPVINVRRLFEMEDRKVDDRTRIIIVDIGGSKTGLLVDEVNEVLRLAKSSIEATQGIMAPGKGGNLLEGICKIDDGKRMVMLLNVDKILDVQELKTLSDLRAKKEPAAKREVKKTAKKKNGKLEIAE